jgi:hypothetical protein
MAGILFSTLKPEIFILALFDHSSGEIHPSMQNNEITKSANEMKS